MIGGKLIIELCSFSSSGTAGLQIISVSVPEVIQNGTKTSVVLDCEYRYEQYEIDGLEVKWFWNDEPEAVYQWIPGKKPEALGIFRVIRSSLTLNKRF